MNRNQVANVLTKRILEIGSNNEDVCHVIESALKDRDDRAAGIVENWDLDCLIPSEIAGKIRSDDLDSF